MSGFQCCHKSVHLLLRGSQTPHSVSTSVLSELLHSSVSQLICHPVFSLSAPEPPSVFLSAVRLCPSAQVFLFLGLHAATSAQWTNSSDTSPSSLTTLSLPCCLCPLHLNHLSPSQLIRLPFNGPESFSLPLSKLFVSLASLLTNFLSYSQTISSSPNC